MFCPRCAAQNVDDAKYCRACGADISLVPQVLTGRLAERLTRAEESEEVGRPSSRRRRRREKEKEPASVEKGVREIIGGVGLVLVSLAVLGWMPGGFTWWFWMLIPAFYKLGEGVSTIMRARREQQQLAPPSFVPPMTAMPRQQARPGAALPSLRTGELVDAPPSVTEGTTRHLGVPIKRTPEDV
ncbi:MAG: zinc-ribbon domain-containing protein [Pyrinomonadaceae bacterium]